jgi:glycosyltransferase involved in cell wall biosynthesis
MILIPARNEAPRIASVVRGVREVAPDAPVVVVVNGTTDDTAEVAERAGAEVIHAEPGYGTALLAGYKHALERPDTDWVVQMDADGQHPAQAIPDLRAALDVHDVVVGSRFAPGGGSPGWQRRRRWTIAALGVATRALTGCPVRDVSSGFQALSRPAIEHLNDTFSVDLTDANVLARLHRAGLAMGEVGVQMPQRAGGQSMHGGISSAIYAGKTLLAVIAEARA